MAVIGGRESGSVAEKDAGSESDVMYEDPDVAWSERLSSPAAGARLSVADSTSQVTCTVAVELMFFIFY